MSWPVHARDPTGLVAGRGAGSTTATAKIGRGHRTGRVTRQRRSPEHTATRRRSSWSAAPPQGAFSVDREQLRDLVGRSWRAPPPLQVCGLPETDLRRGSASALQHRRRQRQRLEPRASTVHPEMHRRNAGREPSRSVAAGPRQRRCPFGSCRSAVGSEMLRRQRLDADGA